jgi:hypothetical protein
MFPKENTERREHYAEPEFDNTVIRTGKRSNKTEDRTERMEGKYQSSIGNGINENL